GLQAQVLTYCGEEVTPIALQLEGDQIVGEQSLEQLPPPRAHAQLIGMRPRDVPEDRGPRDRPELPQLAGDEREMVVLDEDRRGGILEVAGDRLGESAVHHLI